MVPGNNCETLAIFHSRLENAHPRREQGQIFNKNILRASCFSTQVLAQNAIVTVFQLLSPGGTSAAAVSTREEEEVLVS